MLSHEKKESLKVAIPAGEKEVFGLFRLHVDVVLDDEKDVPAEKADLR